MHHRPVRKALLIATVLVGAGLACIPVTPALSDEAPASAAAEVRSVWSAVDAKWNARDAEQFSELFAEDISFEFVDRGEALVGRAAVLEHFAKRFPSLAPDLRHRTRVRQVLPIGPDALAMDGNVEILRNQRGAETELAVLRRFAIFAVMTRNSEGLGIRALRIYELRAKSTTGGADTE